MTRFARAGKCGAFGARGLTLVAEAASKPSASNRDARASRPKPPPARRKNSRRLASGEISRPGPGHSLMKSIDINKRVDVEQSTAKLIEGRFGLPPPVGFQEGARQTAFGARWQTANDPSK